MTDSVYIFRRAHCPWWIEENEGGAESGRMNGGHGIVRTSNGIVEAMTWWRGAWPGNHKKYQGTFLEFYFGGRKFERRFKKPYSRQYCVTLADRFTREIVEEKE